MRFAKFATVKIGQEFIAFAAAQAPGGMMQGETIDIGKWSPTFPVTSPYVRVRIRRFGGLS